jgi:class 3 adenylate cyclase/CHASE2 domain-containing sensor protein
MIGRWIAFLRQAGLARIAVPAMVALASAAVMTLAVENVAFLKFGDRFVADWETAALLPAEPQDSGIVVVAITEDTLKKFAYRSPIDRRFLAGLLTTLASRAPRAIGLDLLFDQPTEPDKDELLRDTLLHLPVPLRVSFSDTQGTVTDDQHAFLERFVPPRLRGLANLATDQFDTVRWIYPGHAGADGQYMLSLPRAIAQDVGVATPAALTDMAWHGQPSRGVPAFREYPAQIVAALPPQWFKDKIVLIGTDLSLTDLHRTPFSTIASDGEGLMPGVMIQAHALAQLLEGRHVPFVGFWGNVLVALVCAGIGATLPLAGGAMTMRVGAGTLFVILLWLGGGALFHYDGIIIGLIAPTMALAAAHWAMEAFAGHEARQQKEFIKGAFSRYVSPKVVDALIANPAKMSLDGERRVMTYLFTDIADFTAMSEALGSHELAHTLNTYLDGVTEIVLKYDATVSKFEGDATFVFFNAPVDQPDHAERAVRCALEIDRFAEAFRAEERAKGVAFGKTRIGIHTGPAVVGNFGSSKRLAYTATGDAVNTASRLEGVNKQFGTRLCISEATRALCHGIPFRPLGSVVVKGKTIGIAVWEPLHDDDLSRSAFLTRYGAAFAKLERLAPEAIDLFAALNEEDPSDPCVALYLDRLRRGEHGVELVLEDK